MESHTGVSPPAQLGSQEKTGDTHHCKGVVGSTPSCPEGGESHSELKRQSRNVSLTEGSQCTLGHWLVHYRGWSGLRLPCL